jgi:hypothetical protein
MRKPLLFAAAMLLTTAPAQAMQRGSVSGDACTEMFHECLRGCGPPGSNPPCETYCEEQVLAKCRGSGAAAKGNAVKPGAVQGGVKTAPAQ